jgi:hypothetical protein
MKKETLFNEIIKAPDVYTCAVIIKFNKLKLEKGGHQELLKAAINSNSLLCMDLARKLLLFNQGYMLTNDAQKETDSPDFLLVQDLDSISQKDKV